jgi:hypothetical protein
MISYTLLEQALLDKDQYFPVQVIKICGGVVAKLHSSLTLAPDRMFGQLHILANLPQRERL